MLNPFAQEWMPRWNAKPEADGSGGSSKAAQTGLRVTTSMERTFTCDTQEVQTPNGLAELASTMSGDLAFDALFDHGSRRPSVVSIPGAAATHRSSTYIPLISPPPQKPNPCTPAAAVGTP
jgi:hypothetical protein